MKLKYKNLIAIFTNNELNVAKKLNCKNSEIKALPRYLCNSSYNLNFLFLLQYFLVNKKKLLLIQNVYF